jgi:hypothetical protein
MAQRCIMRPCTAGCFGIALAAVLTLATGCGTEMLQPDFEARNQFGNQILDLYKRSDGFWWQDDDVWSKQQKKGIITLKGNQLTADGGFCGPKGSGDCTATFSSSWVKLSLPDYKNPLIEYHLGRNNGALDVRDAQDNLLVSLQARSAGADIFDGQGNLIGTADPDENGRLWVSNWDHATIGSSTGAVPPEIAALAQGAMLDTGTHPSIPGHAIVIAAALTWLR